MAAPSQEVFNQWKQNIAKKKSEMQERNRQMETNLANAVKKKYYKALQRAGENGDAMFTIKFHISPDEIFSYQILLDFFRHEKQRKCTHLQNNFDRPWNMTMRYTLRFLIDTEIAPDEPSPPLTTQDQSFLTKKQSIPTRIVNKLRDVFRHPLAEEESSLVK